MGNTLARMTTANGDADDEHVLREAMAMERCQLLLRRWERQWYGLPKRERANADLLERYEWVYGRSMGNRDEVLQRLRDGSARIPVMEYSNAFDATGSMSSAGLLSQALLTPEASMAHDQGRRASLLDTTTGADISFDLLRRKESTNSWRYRIFPTTNLDSPESSFESPSHIMHSSSDTSDFGTHRTSMSPQRSSQAPKATAMPPPPPSPTPTPATLTPNVPAAPRSKSSPSALQPQASAQGAASVAPTSVQRANAAQHGPAQPGHAAVGGVQPTAGQDQARSVMPASAPSSSMQQRTLPPHLQHDAIDAAAPDAAAAAAARAARAATQQHAANGRAQSGGNGRAERSRASGGKPTRKSRSRRSQENGALNGQQRAATQAKPVARTASGAQALPAPPHRGSADEARVAREAWNWRFARKWILERNRAGVDLDDEGKAFQAILAGELTDKDVRQQAAHAQAQAQPPIGRTSNASLSRGATLSESLMFPAEHPLQTRSSRTSMRASLAHAKEHGVRY